MVPQCTVPTARMIRRSPWTSGRPVQRGGPAAAIITLLAVAALITLVAAGTQQPPPGPDLGRDAPLLDPKDPNGAWAGYSAGKHGGPPVGTRIPAGAVAGMDVSGHQRDVDWPRAMADGARFTYIKTSEGNAYNSPVFSHQYDGAGAAGMIRGGYHFALPDRSSGAQQAHFFVDNGGGWTRDGKTLPGAVDIETNPYGDVCYRMNPQQLAGWLTDFSTTYASRTGRTPMIYTTSRWWHRCTADNPSFAAHNPLWVARYAPEIGPLPAGWGFHTMWQFADAGKFPGDQNTFNGSIEQLRNFVH